MDTTPELEQEIGAESEATIRNFDGKILGKVVYWLAIAIAIFHIWVNNFSLMSELWRNAIHMGSLGP